MRGPDGAPRRCTPQRFRHPRSLRRHTEGCRAERLPGRDAGRHRPRHSRPRRAGRRAGTCGLLSLFSARHHFSRRRRSRASVRRAAALPPSAATTGSSRRTTACCRRCFARRRRRKVVELTERKYARPTVSRTFEGRDRFAPAAGWLAKGIALVSLGKSISNYQVLDLPRPVVTAGRHQRRNGARRSLRQPDYQYRSAHARAVRRRPARSGSPSATVTSRASWPPTRRRRRVNCVHSSAAPIISRSRSTRGMRRGSSASAVARGRFVRLV